MSMKAIRSSKQAGRPVASAKADREFDQSVRRYLRQMANVPMLTKDEEAAAFKEVEASVKPRDVGVEVQVRVDSLEVARHLVAGNRPAPLREGADVLLRRILRKHASSQLLLRIYLDRIYRIIRIILLT